jgi:SsrA-binding protein
MVTAPDRERSIFLKKKDIDYLMGKVKEKGLTIVPTEVYLKGSLVKVSAALVR